ncbi:MAG: hypothetical protein Q8N77_00915 [Nanoarchaeota archaeon]|nr:hypothetical protein [Nanoarchaeota archaeon]
MKIPPTFIPDKNLEEKTEQLLKEKKISFKPEDYDFIYKRLSSSLYDYINLKLNSLDGILCISDTKENRYGLIKDILEEIIARLNVSYKLELLNYYGEPEDKDLFNELNNAVSYKIQDKSSMCIIYTSERMTDEIAKDVTKWRMLMSKANVSILV